MHYGRLALGSTQLMLSSAFREDRWWRRKQATSHSDRLARDTSRTNLPIVAVWELRRRLRFPLDSSVLSLSGSDWGRLYLTVHIRAAAVLISLCMRI